MKLIGSTSHAVFPETVVAAHRGESVREPRKEPCAGTVFIVSHAQALTETLRNAHPRKETCNLLHHEYRIHY